MTQNVLSNDEAVTWSKHFFFVTFERYVTNLRGTFAPIPISTHPTVHAIYYSTITTTNVYSTVTTSQDAKPRV
jgi:hypothetical protein